MPDALVGYLSTVDYAGQLAAWAGIESCSDDRVGLQEFAGVLGERFVAAGADVAPVGDTHLLARWHGQGQPILLLGHFDTVYARGTLDDMPVRRRGNKLYGPGVVDMKGGLLVGCVALEALRWLERMPRRPVWYLCTSDEELGSPSSRALIELLARESVAALVLEGAGNGGAVKTERKGVGLWQLHVYGRAAHAGVAPEQGRNALHELAHQILWIQTLNDPEQGTSVHVTTAKGGTTSNVIPAAARAVINVRVRSMGEAERLARAFGERQAVLEDVRIEFGGGINRPPMERSAVIARLFERAQQLAGELGFTLEETSTGGGSDGNFTAALGVPTLDGLGPIGGGAHATHEHVLLDSFVPRTALLARLIETL